MQAEGIVLAAGESRRMGLPKWSRKIAGKTFLEHIICSYRTAGIDKIYVVMREDPGDFPDEYTILINPDPDRGKLSTLQTAIPFLSDESPFFMQLVDRPLVKPSTFIKMLQSYDGLRIVIPSFIKRKGHPVLFPPGIKSVIKSTSYSEGIRGAILGWQGGVNIIEVDDEAILWNIDTKEDLRYFSKRLYDLPRRDDYDG